MGGYPGMIRLAEKHPQETKLKVEFLDLPGERIPLEDGSIDTVKPGGRLIFFEHGLAPDARIRRWQQWSDPIPRRVFEGCYVTRDIPSLITGGGFQMEQMETAYLAPFQKSWTYCFWGTATPGSK